MLNKKIIPVILVIVLSFGLIGCKADPPKNGETPVPAIGSEENNPNAENQEKPDQQVSDGKTTGSNEQGPDPGKVSQGDLKEKLKKLVQRSEDMVREQKWAEAGNYLLQAKELSGDEGFLTLENIEGYQSTLWMEDSIITALMGGHVFTKEDGRLFMEQKGFSIPEEPKLDILEREAHEVLAWFRDYRNWFMSMILIPWDNYFQSGTRIPEAILFLGDSLDELTELRKKYFKEGYDEYMAFNSFWIELGGKTFHYSGVGDFGLTDTFLELSVTTNKILDFEARENEVFFKIFHNGAGYDVYEGVYGITYDIERKTDGTFRVGDYRYERIGE